MTEFDKGQMSA